MTAAPARFTFDLDLGNGRPERASPAEGYVSTHEVMQRQIVQRALTVQRPRRAARKRAQA